MPGRGDSRALRAAAAASYPKQRPANDPWLTKLMQAGEQFWRGRGVNVPDGVRLTVADSVKDTPGDDSLGRALDGQLYMDGNYVGRQLALARSRSYSTRDRRSALNALARVMFHELGHVGGLGHTQSGLMDHDTTREETPFEAAHLARMLIPRDVPVRARVRGNRGMG